ncbi:MAG: single-stranded DNA-binding protein [Treponema sp.]|nr:single-stranded DNA-binding protein [Treponema sp.]
MADLNHVVLIGRLTRDAEVKITAGGQAVTKFSIAVNRRKKVGDNWEDEANYFDIVLWGKQGESLQSYLVKGKMVGVDGELRQDRWQQDGQNRSKVEIVASYVQLLGGGQSSGDRQNYQNSSNGSGSSGNSGGGSSDSYNSNSGSSDNFTDDIPF